MKFEEMIEAMEGKKGDLKILSKEQEEFLNKIMKEEKDVAVIARKMKESGKFSGFELGFFLASFLFIEYTMNFIIKFKIDLEDIVKELKKTEEEMRFMAGVS